MKAIKNIEHAIRLIDAFEGRPEDFELAVSDELQDPVGMNMALITDHILKKGWVPDGFEEREGWRIYRYKVLK